MNSAGAELVEGLHVRLQGLKAKPELNGAEALLPWCPDYIYIYALIAQGKFHLLPPYYPFPRGKIRTRGNIWSFTVG